MKNTDNPERCVVRLFLKYISKRPQGAPDNILFASSFNVQQISVVFKKASRPQQASLYCEETVLVWMATKQTTPSKRLLQQDFFRQGVMSSSSWMSQNTEAQMVYSNIRRFLLSSARLLLELSRIPTRRQSTKHKSQSQMELHAQLCRMLRSPSASVVTSKASLSTFKGRIRSSGGWQLLTLTLD